MIDNTQYIINNKGENISVILPIKNYERILEKLEDLEDILLYDKAKKEDNGEYVLFSDYIKNRKKDA